MCCKDEYNPMSDLWMACLLAGLIIGFIAGGISINEGWKESAVKGGNAHYTTHTGSFVFVWDGWKNDAEKKVDSGDQK